MPWVAALALAWRLRHMGQPRIGALLLLQWSAGLRPGEVLRLRKEDLVPAFMNITAPSTAILQLGVGRGTKVGRPQCAFLPWGEVPIGVLALHRFWSSTPPGALLTTPLTPAQYRG